MKIVNASLAVALLASSAIAQTPPAAPPKPAPVSKDPAAAPSGNYKIDPLHASVIAVIGHRGGLSFSTFRFSPSAGTVTWNAADPARSSLDVTIDMTSIQTPVPNFAAELLGERFLNTAKFPTATFVSKSITRTGPTTGKIAGDMTFMGHTKPVTIDGSMVGTTIVKGAQVIGFSGKLSFKRSDFGYTSLIGPIGDDVDMKLDVEFDKTT